MIGTLTATVLLALGFLAPAGSPPRPDAWVGYPCQVGAIDLGGITTAPEADEVTRIEVPGQLGCGVGSQRRFFALVPFELDGLMAYGRAHQNLLGAFPATGPVTFRATAAVSPGQQFGLCLMPDPRTLLSCVRISGAPGSATVTPLSLANTIWYVEENLVEADPQPQCATCWTVAD